MREKRWLGLEQKKRHREISNTSNNFQDYLNQVEEHVNKSHEKDWTLGIGWSRMEGIVSDILEDQSWIMDSHDRKFYEGMRYGLQSMLKHLKEINRM